MDISNINANPRDIEIYHPGTREPIGLTITVLPVYHKQVKKAQRERFNKAANDRRPNKKHTLEQIEESNDALLAAAVGGWEWEGDTTFEGEKPECTEDNVRRVFKALPWVKAQVKDEFDQYEAFFEG